ncbi:MAG TPA: translocation/assembly module TamB domain-containing protein, partial [Tahibacter sp.]|nr:translocation/assembly module TamB domain-containing protein [Tahibacter sp.]
LDKLDGKLRDRAVTGTADLKIAPGFIVDGTAAFASGQSTVAVRGRGGNDTNATVGFTVASLGDLVPDAQGRVRGEFTLRGKWPALAVNGRLEGQTLGMGENRVASLELNADIADTGAPRGSFDLLATGVTAGGLAFERISVDGKGDRASHEVKLAANGSPLTARTTLRGRSDGANWSGTLAELALAIKDQPEWTLEQPAAIALKDGAATVGDICLAANGPRLCFSANQTADGAANARYRIERLPLAMIAALAAPDAPFTLTGEIHGQGDVRRGADGALNGTAQIGSTEGRVAYPDTDAGKPLLDYKDFAIDATLSPASQDVVIRAALSDGGSIGGRIGIAGPEQALSGQIALALNSLSFVELFTPELGAVKGKVAGQLSFAGTVAAPQVGGNVAVSEFATEVPAAGLKLHDGNVRVELLDGQRFAITGSIASGDGKLAIEGAGGMAADAPLTISVDGKNFLAADIPAAKVLLGPKLKIERNAEKLTVGGEVEVPYANVDLTKLPGGGAAKASPDVVVTDAEHADAAKALPVTADILVKLGDDVRLKGFGLDGKLDGQLAIVERPGRQTTGRGEIRVGGTYKAYGQDLKIRTGRLLFAGTAVDNPGLDIQAVRELKDVTAGLRVQGTAQVPVLTVFSEPAMEQSEALSYLVTGRPLSALKSGDSDMVGAAAQALGSATGDLLAKSVGARLGVDAAVSDNAAIGGSAFTVGKYLSPKLYLSYGVGIFTPGEVITLRYKLSKRWELEAQNATTENRAGLNYRWEK